MTEPRYIGQLWPRLDEQKQAATRVGCKLSALDRTCPECKRGNAMNEDKSTPRNEETKTVLRVCRFCGHTKWFHFSRAPTKRKSDRFRKMAEEIREDIERKRQASGGLP